MGFAGMKVTTTRIENNGSGSDRESRRKPWPWPSTTSSSVPRSSRGVAGEEGPAGEKKTIPFSIFLRPQSWAWARSSICNAWESNRRAGAGESNGLRSFNRALFSLLIFQAEAATGDDTSRRWRRGVAARPALKTASRTGSQAQAGCTCAAQRGRRPGLCRAEQHG